MQMPIKSRTRQILIGAAIIFFFGIIICAALLGSRRIPGVPGEALSMAVGILTTPFLMEFSFVTAGFILIAVFRNFREQRDGDEFVEMEVPDKIAPQRKKPRN